MPTPQFRASLDYEGLGLALEFPDGLAEISSSNDLQTLTIGKPAGSGTFTLTLQPPGQSSPRTTAPIAVNTTPPANYALLTAPLPGPGPATIGVSWVPFGDANRNVRIEVFDGSLAGPRLLDVWVDQTQPAAGSNDPDGQPYFLLPAATFATATALVRLSGVYELTGANNRLYLAGMKVTPQGGATAYYPCDATAAHYTLAPANGWPGRSGVVRFDNAAGAGDCTWVDVAEVQAKLVALPGIGAGNVTVAEWVAPGEDLHQPDPSLPGNSDPTTTNHFATRSLRTHIVTFAGALTHLALPPMTSSDAGVTVAHTQVGGQFPAITLAGVAGVADGTTLVLRDAWAPMRQADFPVGMLYLPFPQYPPAQVLKGGTTDFIPDDVHGHWNWVGGAGHPDVSKGAYYFRALRLGINPQGDPYGGDGIGATALWDAQRPGTFALRATWVADPAHTTAARYLIYRHDDALQAAKDAALNAANAGGDAAQLAAARALGTTVELARVTVDQTVPPAGPTIAGTVWQTLATGLVLPDSLGWLIARLDNLGAAGSALCCDAVALDRTSGEASLIAGPGATATLAIPANYWLTNAGPVAAAAAFPVTNSHGRELIAIPGPGAATSLRSGHNLSANIGLTFLPNYAIQGVPDLWDGNPGSQAPFFPDVDPDGYPTRMRGDSGTIAINGVGFNPGSSWKGFGTRNVPAGDWTIVWDGTAAGTSVFQLMAEAPATVAEVSRSIGTGPNTVDNVMVFRLDCGPNYGASILYRVLNAGVNPDGSRICAFKRLRIYPPGIDWHAPPRFLPASRAWTDGAKYLRAMDGIRAIGGNWTELAEINRPNALSYYAPTSSRSFPVADVRAYTGPPVAIPGSQNFQITTPTPHGIGDDRNVGFVPVAPDVISYTNGQTEPSLSGFTTRLSDTVFVISVGRAAPMANVLTRGTCTVSTSTEAWNLVDFVDLCVAEGADLHLTLELCVSYQGASDIADFWLAHTPPGLVLCAEMGNEVWNETTDHHWRAANHGYRLNQVGTAGLPNVNDWWTWMLLRGGQVHEIMRRRFAAAGRPNDFRRVFGVNYGNYDDNVRQVIGTAAITPVILNGTLAPGVTNFPAYYTGGELVSDHVPIDDLTMAPYVGVNPFNNSNNMGFANERPYNEFLTKGQILTLWSLAVRYGGFGAQFARAMNVARIHAGGKYAAVRGTAYEGGLQNPVPIATFANYPRRCQEVVRDPRMHDLMLAFLAELQAGGCERIAIYQLQGDTPWQPPGAYWGEVQAWDERLGTGSPAENTDPMDLAHLYSQRAGGVNHWNALAPGATSTVTGVTVSPATVLVPGGSNQPFTATVTGTGGPSTAVTWAATLGTITAAGLWTAPAATAAAQPATITATSTQDPTKAGTATATVPAAAATITGVTVSPATVTLDAGQTQQFTAMVTGTGAFSTAVVWAVPLAGTITAGGLYTAPARTNAVQTIAITASSSQDGTKAGSATVTVPALAVATVTGVTVSPATPTVPGGATQQFTAAVAGANNPSQGVTWTASLGTITAGGLWTAPAVIPSLQVATITATSVFDPTKAGTATATVPALAVTVTGVTVSPAAATVAGGAGRTFTATVLGTNSPPQAVTWAASLGAVDAAGSWTAPAATVAVQTATITATSVFDPTRSGTATATVPAAGGPWTRLRHLRGLRFGVATP